MSCINLKFGFRKRNGVLEFLMKSLVLIRKFGARTMFLCLFLHDLLVWVPRSMFLNSWHEISDFVTSYDLCIHLLHDHVHHVLQRETQVFPTLLLNVAIGTTPRQGGVGPRQRPVWYPVCFHKAKSSVLTPSMFCFVIDLDLVRMPGSFACI